MIDIVTLKESDRGRHVIYRTYGKIEHGKITRWNANFIFVRYYEAIENGVHRPRYGETSEATRPQDLEWAYGESPVHTFIRENKSEIKGEALMKINELFSLGMKRSIPELRPRGENCINLGCGNQVLPFCQANYDLPIWNGETDPIPEETGTVDTIFAFHFFEHFSGTNVIRLLRECQRVLTEGGQLNVVVQHRLSQMAYHDLDHKTFWTEETWRVLFSTPYYDKNREEPWEFEIGTNIIIGIVERNLALMTQLIRR